MPEAAEEFPTTPTKQKATPLRIEEEEDTWESWEDTDPTEIQLATTPVKEVLVPRSAPSPGPVLVYDLHYLLQFRNEPPNPRVKALFPAPAPVRRDLKEDHRQDERRAKPAPPRRADARMGFGQPQDAGAGAGLAPRERPFAHLGMTSDQRLVVMDPDAAPPANPFFQPTAVAARPLFGTQMGGGKGGGGGGGFGGPGGQGGGANPKAQRAWARLENRVANPFKVQRPENGVPATVKRVQGVLNKITPEKYQELFELMWEELNEFNLYDVNDVEAMEVLDHVIGLIFEKALAESTYSRMYADIARDLCDQAIRISHETGNSEARPLEHFRKMLLDRCQTEFESRVTDLPADPHEQERLKNKHRKRGVGNIKFIAELFQLGMLTEKIMHDVIKSLLLGPPPHSEQYLPSPEELEVLCKLWSVSGKLLDRPKAVEYINYYFTIMARHAQTYPDLRLRFIMADIIDLRKHQWIPRRGDAKRHGEEADGHNHYVPSAASKDPKTRSSKRSAAAATADAAKGDPRSGSNPGDAGDGGGGGRGRAGSSKSGKSKDSRRVKVVTTSPATPEAPKELSPEEMDGKVVWLVAEFAETQSVPELLECLADLGAHNHALFVTRAVYRVIENHRLVDERATVAAILSAFLAGSEDKAAAKQHAAALLHGFQAALRDVFEFEAWTDSPFLWHDLCEFLLQLLVKGVIQFDFLNGMMAPDVYAQFPEVLSGFVAELFTQLQGKEAEWVCCTAFYRVLGLFPADHVPLLLRTLQEKGVLETDPTLYMYHALTTDLPPDQCLAVLEARVDEEVLASSAAVVCAKVAAGALAALTDATARRTNAQEPAEEIAAAERAALGAARPLLLRYLPNGDPELEVANQVAVLNELHRACARARFPKGHMGRMFQLLHEVGVCSSFAYEDWIEGPSDLPDKGKAIFEVNSFLQSLKAPEPGDVEEDAEGEAAAAEGDGPGE